MDFFLPGGKQLRLIAPFSDMLNHSSDVKVCHMYDQQTKELKIIAGKDYEVGDQVKMIILQYFAYCNLKNINTFYV